MAVNKEQIDFMLSSLGTSLTPEQSKIIYLPNREILVAGGERAGKSFFSSTFLMTRLPFGKLYWLVAADYGRTQAEFNYIQDFLSKLGWSYEATKRVDPGEISIAGGFIIKTKSAQDYRKIAMEAPDGVVICESSQVDYETYLRVRGRIAEKRGWMLMSGTFESSLGWYPELYTKGQNCHDSENLISASLPTWSNIKIFPGGRTDPEILKLESASSKEWFSERYGGVPCPPKGRVFEEFSTQIHTGIGGVYEFDPNLDVKLWVDPGFSTAYAVLVAQIRGDDVCVVDEIYERGMVTSDIITMCKLRPWWSKVNGGAIDIAAKQHQALPAVTEVWLSEGKVYLDCNRIEIRDGIERVKNFLLVNPKTGASRLHINAKCRGLISEMGECPNPITNQTAVYQWKQDREGNITGEVPEDKNNHACKALSYGLINSFGYTKPIKNVAIKYF
jgi:hypothetical protein